MLVASSLRVQESENTKEGAHVPEAGGYKVTVGPRPNLSQLLASAIPEDTAWTSAILACGPATLVDTSRDAAFDLRCDFHAESFFM